jgi:hypothetical protein
MMPQAGQVVGLQQVAGLGGGFAAGYHLQLQLSRPVTGGASGSSDSMGRCRKLDKLCCLL